MKSIAQVEFALFLVIALYNEKHFFEIVLNEEDFIENIIAFLLSCFVICLGGLLMTESFPIFSSILFCCLLFGAIRELLS